jgi:hypothetical protein
MEAPALLAKHTLEEDGSIPMLKKQKTQNVDARDVRHGVAPIKPEYGKCLSKNDNLD